MVYESRERKLEREWEFEFSFREVSMMEKNIIVIGTRKGDQR